MNILIFSNPSYGKFGYSIVTRKVANGLKATGHDVLILGNVTTGGIIKDDDGNKNLPMYFTGWGEDALEHYLKAYDIDIVIVILDVWVSGIQYLPKLLKKMKIPLITHATIRSHPLSPYVARFLTESDHVIAPSRFSYNTAKEWNEISNKVHYIPHGVDLKTFKPIRGMKKKMKKKLGYDNKFVYLSVGRNNFNMKAYWLLFRAFKQMLENEPQMKNNCILHLHCYPMEGNSINLEILVDRVGLRKYVRFSKERPLKDWSGTELCSQDDPHAMPHNPNFGMDGPQMAEMYNMADVHVMASEGESFGLPIIESQACGIPQIFPNHTVGPELIGDPNAGLLAGNVMPVTNHLISDVYHANPMVLGKCMHHMYLKKKDREKFSENAKINAKKYSWDKIIPMWVNLVDNVGKNIMETDYSRGVFGV